MTQAPPTRNRPARGPSMGDVAEYAGVSTQTVSRVANGLTNVEAATRDRVLQAMQALGYRPNKAARALRSGHFRNIGVIMFTLSSFGNMRTLDAIAISAARAGYSLTLVPVERPTSAWRSRACSSRRSTESSSLSRRTSSTRPTSNCRQDCRSW
jgi:DNA-binding LacI/PurR family transcriptional regulator